MSSSCEAEANLEILIRQFRRQFGCAAHLDAFDWKDLFEHLILLEYEVCESHIDRIISATVEDFKFKTYPPKLSFQRGFLKRFAAEAERNGVPHERLYELIVESLSDSQDVGSDPSAHYKHYFVQGTRFVVKETVSIISGGTTGLCTWQAGIALANWVLTRPEIISGRHLLELGCGVGLTGLALIFSENPPSSYVFTDVHPSVLNALRDNLKINTEHPFESVSCVRKTSVQVETLDWASVSDVKSILEHKPEIILAADVVYCLDLIPILCDALKCLLECYKETIVVIACTIRNPETLNCFLQRINFVGLDIIEECDAPVENCELYCPDNSSVKIFIISTSRS